MKAYFYSLKHNVNNNKAHKSILSRNIYSNLDTLCFHYAHWRERLHPDVRFKCDKAKQTKAMNEPIKVRHSLKLSILLKKSCKITSNFLTLSLHFLSFSFFFTIFSTVLSSCNDVPGVCYFNRTKTLSDEMPTNTNTSFTANA